MKHNVGVGWLLQGQENSTKSVSDTPYYPGYHHLKILCFDQTKDEQRKKKNKKLNFISFCM